MQQFTGQMSRAAENGNAKKNREGAKQGGPALTHIESSDDAGGVPRNELQIGGRLAVQEPVLGRESPAC